MHDAFPPDPPSLSLLSSSSATLERGPTAALPIPLTPLIGRAPEVVPAGGALRSPEVRLIGTTYPIDALRTGLRGQQAPLLDGFDLILAAAPLLADLCHG
jgi:hypothetical protein